MVSKVTLSLLVLCLCLSQSLQFPDHNRTRREDTASMMSQGFSVEDFQKWLNSITKWFPGGLGNMKEKDVGPEPDEPTPDSDKDDNEE